MNKTRKIISMLHIQTGHSVLDDNNVYVSIWREEFLYGLCTYMMFILPFLCFAGSRCFESTMQKVFGCYHTTWFVSKLLRWPRT